MLAVNGITWEQVATAVGMLGVFGGVVAFAVRAKSLASSACRHVADHEARLRVIEGHIGEIRGDIRVIRQMIQGMILKGAAGTEGVEA